MPWAALLQEAVTKPGCIHEAYSRFRSYSLGNQLLALFQCFEQAIHLHLGLRQNEPIGYIQSWASMITCDPATCDPWIREASGWSIRVCTTPAQGPGSDQQSRQESVKSRGLGDRVSKH
jgi:hypothetical protein